MLLSRIVVVTVTSILCCYFCCCSKKKESKDDEKKKEREKRRSHKYETQDEFSLSTLKTAGGAQSLSRDNSFKGYVVVVVVVVIGVVVVVYNGKNSKVGAHFRQILIFFFVQSQQLQHGCSR